MKIKCGHCQNEEKCNVLHEQFVTCNGCGAVNSILNKKDYGLHEWLNFNYLEYLRQIISVISEYNFDEIKAQTQAEIKAGKFTDIEIERFRRVMNKGFVEEKTIRQIADDINNKVKPRDLFQTKDGEILLRNGKPVLKFNAATRGIILARTETTRIANLGALAQFKAKEVKEVVFTATTGSSRLCPICDSYDGKIFPINQREVQIPVHSYCRCTWINITG